MADNLIRPAEAERDRVIASLSDHYALGRLTLEELDQRVEQALRAQNRDQLKNLLLDLPADPMASPPPPVRPDVPPAAGLLTRSSWTPWAVTAVLCLVIWLGTSLTAGAALYFWPMWVIGPWGVANAVRSSRQGDGDQRRHGCQFWSPAVAPSLHGRGSRRH